MFVRTLGGNEILMALKLAWEVYASDVAPLQKPEAVAGFQNLIRYEMIAPRIQSGEITLFGAWEGQELCGISGIDRKGSILLLYVRKPWQRKGVGRQLMQAMYQFCAQVLVVTRITMKVVPSGAVAMNHLGMRDVAPVQTEGPETFIPMEIMIAPGAMKPGKRKNKAVIGAVVIAVIALIVLLAAMIYREARNVFRAPDTQYDHDMYGEFDDWFGDGIYQDDNETLSGVDAIPEYRDETPGFEVKEENYLYSPEDTKTTYVDFEINYPQLDGLEDAAIQEKINQELKNCAMETVDRIYENPDTKIKERVLGEQNPVIADYVKYKITYLTEEYICVAYEDYSYEGSRDSYYVGIRTKNIDLKSGTVFEVKDIVDLDERFVKEWLEAMRNEAESSELLSELDTKELKEALSGDNTQEGTYLPVFFADKEGIEIGFSFHYEKGDENDVGYGWVTAPVKEQVLKKYRTESPFWDLIK